ncbi:hypothetical protein H7H80_21985 [Mycobacterium interjectum]|nr:hypothetical protein [Mycobacterium interjectum]
MKGPTHSAFEADCHGALGVVRGVFAQSIRALLASLTKMSSPLAATPTGLLSPVKGGTDCVAEFAAIFTTRLLPPSVTKTAPVPGATVTSTGRSSPVKGSTTAEPVAGPVEGCPVDGEDCPDLVGPVVAEVAVAAVGAVAVVPAAPGLLVPLAVQAAVIAVAAMSATAPVTPIS